MCYLTIMLWHQKWNFSKEIIGHSELNLRHTHARARARSHTRTCYTHQTYAGQLHKSLIMFCCPVLCRMKRRTGAGPRELRWTRTYGDPKSSSQSRSSSLPNPLTEVCPAMGTLRAVDNPVHHLHQTQCLIILSVQLWGPEEQLTSQFTISTNPSVWGLSRNTDTLYTL